MKKIYLIAVVTALCLTSCYSASTYVGNMTPNTPEVKVKTVRHSHFIGGLIGKGKLDAKKYGVGENYKVTHQLSFVDYLLSGITLGIYTPSTSKIYVPANEVQNLNTQSSSNNVSSSNGVRMIHKVKDGETIQTIANLYQVSVKDIINWNQLQSIDLETGTPLIIFIK